MAIPFVREIDPAYGQAVPVSPLIRRLTAPNPGPFTYFGTGVYIVGQGEVAVIDPGPDLLEHLDALERALAGERIGAILVTHGHADHCPAARPLAARTGAKIYANAAPMRGAPLVAVEAEEDAGFHPDIGLTDGDVISGPGWSLEAIFTPGHASNHVSFALAEENALFSGDHVMGWSTTVIAPPDGDMEDYFASLARVRERDFATYWPTHGPPIRDPGPFVDALIAHRLEREAQILRELARGPRAIQTMVPALYADVDPRLYPAAAQSMLAHLIRLVRTGVARCEGEPGLASLYTRA